MTLQNGTALLTNGSLNLTVNVIAENLTGRLVSESSTWSQVLSQGLPILSLIIAIYSLWYSQLQGPKISLVEKPNIQLIELPKREFNEGYIPSTLHIKKLDLFFVNSGNRAGILKDVRAEMRLDKNVKLYLSELEHINVKYGSSQNDDFLIILDGSAEHIFIEDIDLVAIEIGKGSAFKKFSLVKDNKNLIAIINTIFNIQRNRLEQFIEFIDKNNTLGKLKISYKFTGRRLFREAIINEKLDLEIKGKYTDTLNGYRQLLNDWNNLPPSTGNILSNIIDFLDSRCKAMIIMNRDQFILRTGVYSIPNDGYKTLLKDHSFEYNLLNKWATSKPFSEKLENLMKKMNELEIIYNKSLIDPSVEPDWHQYRTDLVFECTGMVNQIDILINKIKIVSRKSNEDVKWILRWM